MPCAVCNCKTCELNHVYMFLLGFFLPRPGRCNNLSWCVHSQRLKKKPLQIYSTVSLDGLPANGSTVPRAL